MMRSGCEIKQAKIYLYREWQTQRECKSYPAKLDKKYAKLH
jgi:hypothetical protein